MKFSTISAALSVPITFAYAQHLTNYEFVLFGAQDSTGATPNYTQGFTVGSVPVKISMCLILLPPLFFLYSKPRR